MNNQFAPAFRKSMSGYNKEDVNNYILNLNKRFYEADRSFRDTIADANAEIAAKDEEIAKLKEYIKEKEDSFARELDEKNATITRISDNAADAEMILVEKNAEVEGLRAEIEALKSVKSAKSNVSDAFGGITDESEKALLFDSISAKTGEIMLIACKTADDIIAKAKREADVILSEANAKKDNMMRNISGSADSVASDISSYIKSAVDGCIGKIYTSIKTIDSEK